MNKNSLIPKFIGETRIGTYYVNPYISLKTDNDIKTIWLNLETQRGYFKKKTSILKKIGKSYSQPIIRASVGKKNDFVLYINNKFKPLFDIFKNYNLPIPMIINFILNPQNIGQQPEQQEFVNYLIQVTQNLTHEDKKELIKFAQLLQNLPKESLPKLLDDKYYTLVFGNLDLDYEIKNNVITQENPELKRVTLSKDDIKDCFEGLVLSEETMNQVFNAVGLKQIFSNPPQLPKKGGAIFIDMGGTGKSLMKSALEKLWKKIGGEYRAKNGIAEFGHGTNYAKLIESWYFGFKGQDNPGYDKIGLFDAAVKNKVPSLLVVDEADRFIKGSQDGYMDESADAIITEFKKYLQKREKGGALGYVITLFIANVEEKQINPQLGQGGERLSVVYFGPPTTESDWLELIKMYFRMYELKFKNRDDKKDLILAKLILQHNKNMQHERYMIVPRKFGPNFCESYLDIYHNIDDASSYEGKDRFDRLHSMLHTNNKKNVILDYDIFLKNFIDNMLLKEVKVAGMRIEYFRKQYYDFIELDFDETAQETDKDDPFIKLEKAEVNIILNDKDIERIMDAKYGFEVLGVKPDETRDNIMKTWRALLVNFVSQGGEGYRFRNRHIHSLMAQKLLEAINGKINNVNKDNIKQAIEDKYNWDEFKHFVNGF